MNKTAQRKAAKLSILAKIYIKLCAAAIKAKAGCKRSAIEAIHINQQLQAVKRVNSKILRTDGRIDKRRQRRFEPWIKNAMVVKVKANSGGYNEQS